jgi:ATPase subunit of ABC transporter with duplicated ATPase domains
MANPQYIYTMVNLGKVVPPKREILKGIYLSFFPGAKIGVLGANGAGKSSLLRIMAGVDHDFIGEARNRCSTPTRTCAAMSRRRCAPNGPC